MGEAIAGADMVILALPYPEGRIVAREQGAALSGVTVVDTCNPVDFSTFDSLLTSPGMSAAEEIAAASPGASVVKAFNTTFASALVAGWVGGLPVDVFVAGDDERAKAQVAALVTGRRHAPGGHRAAAPGPGARGVPAAAHDAAGPAWPGLGERGQAAALTSACAGTPCHLGHSPGRNRGVARWPRGGGAPSVSSMNEDDEITAAGASGAPAPRHAPRPAPAAPVPARGQRRAAWLWPLLAIGAVLAVYLVGRGIAELILINYGDPASYAKDWGGPSLAGVLAVHSGPGVVIVAAAAWSRPAWPADGAADAGRQPAASRGAGPGYPG